MICGRLAEGAISVIAKGWRSGRLGCGKKDTQDSEAIGVIGS
jgi:hypothetical protein